MTDRITGIIDRLTDADQYSDIAWILDAPVENIAWSVVDDTMKANADFQYKAGLPAKVVRKTEPSGFRSVKRGNKTITYRVPCKWCQMVAGTYTYPNVPKEVWQRHDGCECIITYTPAGGGKTQTISGSNKGWEIDRDAVKVRKSAPSVGTVTKDEQETLKKVATGKIVDIEPDDLKQTGPGKVDMSARKYDTDTQNMQVYETLADEYGGTITPNGEVTEPSGFAKYPNEFTWNGKTWHVTPSYSGIDGAIRNWTSKSDGFIIDIRDNGVTKGTGRLSTVEREVKEALQKYATKPTDVIIMKDGEILEAFRYEI